MLPVTVGSEIICVCEYGKESRENAAATKRSLQMNNSKMDKKRGEITVSSANIIDYCIIY